MGLAELFFFGRIVPILMSEYGFPKNRKTSGSLLQHTIVSIRSVNDRLRCFMDSYAKINAGCATKILFSGGLRGIVCPALHIICFVITKNKRNVILVCFVQKPTKIVAYCVTYCSSGPSLGVLNSQASVARARFESTVPTQATSSR